MEVLVYLSQHADRVVSRERILEEIWTGVVVSVEVLTNAIRELRRALGDDAKAPDCIKTIPKKGYCLIAPIATDGWTYRATFAFSHWKEANRDICRSAPFIPSIWIGFPMAPQLWPHVPRREASACGGSRWTEARPPSFPLAMTPGAYQWLKKGTASLSSW